MASLPDNIGSFSENTGKLWENMNSCTLCPRKCKANRNKGETGFCGIADMPVVSSVGPHFGEESELVGFGGSGTIFFAGCNLGCIFCQNFDISHQRHGSEMTIEQLAQSMIGLQNYGCCNINLVTPTHLVAPIMTAIESARKKGLKLPIVYNTGGYDSVETLELLAGMIDIYMPDMKYSDSKVARPCYKASSHTELNRRPTTEEIESVRRYAVEKGLNVLL